MSFKVTIAKHDEDMSTSINGEDATLMDVPQITFAFAQHHGNGVYVCNAAEDVTAEGEVEPSIRKGDPIYKLTHEWVEEDE